MADDNLLDVSAVSVILEDEFAKSLTSVVIPLKLRSSCAFLKKFPTTVIKMTNKATPLLKRSAGGLCRGIINLLDFCQNSTVLELLPWNVVVVVLVLLFLLYNLLCAKKVKELELKRIETGIERSLCESSWYSCTSHTRDDNLV